MYPYSAFNPALYNPYMGHPMAGMNPMMMGMMNPMMMGMMNPMMMNPMMMGNPMAMGMNPLMMGYNPMLFQGGAGAMGYPGMWSPAAGMQLDYSQATHTEALGQSQSTGAFSAGGAAWALRFGVEGLEWYGRRMMRAYPHIAHAAHGVGAARAGAFLRGMGNGRPAAWGARVLGQRWSGRIGGWWANAAANKMVGQAGLRMAGNPAARAAMSGLDDVARGMAGAGQAGRSTALAVRGTEVAARGGQAVARTGGRAVATTVGKGLGRLVPVMNVGIAALDGAQFVSDMRDPDAGVGRRVASGVTAGLSAVAATNIPVVSQVAGIASLGAALIRDLF